MEYKQIVRSHGFKAAVFVVCGLVVLGIAFCAGRLSGYRYEGEFGRLGRSGFGWHMDRGWGYGMMGGYGGYGMMGGSYSGQSNYAAMGQVTGVSGSSLTVADHPSGTQKTVNFDANTKAYVFRQEISAANIKAGDMVMVYGTVGANGAITATQIFVMPWGAQATTTQTQAL